MILENCCQVNSNFFYSKHFNFTIMPYKKKFSVNPKKLNQTKFNSLMEFVVFTEGYVTHLETSEGEFLFYGVTHDLETKQILSILKNHHQLSPTDLNAAKSITIDILFSLNIFFSNSLSNISPS